MTFSRAFIFVLSLALALPLSLHGQTHIAESDSDQLRGFGAAMAIGEGEIFVGSRSSNRMIRIEQGPGSVYVFTEDESGNWIEQVQLSASDGAVDDRFGFALDSEGATLVVGAPGQEAEAGAAYVFEKTESGAWVETGRLSIDGTSPTDNYAYTVAVVGDFVFVAAVGKENGGSVYAFHKEAGTWAFHSEIVSRDLEAGDRFGSRMLADGSSVWISAPGKNERKGALYMFRLDPSSNAWGQETKLSIDEGGDTPDFGWRMVMQNDDLFVGAPGYDGAGAVLRFHKDGERWEQKEVLLPFTRTSGSAFGYRLASAGHTLLVGEYFNAEGGVVYAYEAGENSDVWARVTRVKPESVAWSIGFSDDLVAHGDVFAAGAPQADYQEGKVFVFTFDSAARSWKETSALFGEVERISSYAGEKIDCEEGTAYAFGCEDVDLVSFISVADISTSRGVNMNDLWGWTDPETGTEYVLAGRNDGTVFLDISDPTAPVYVGELPKTAASPASVWRDIKVYKDHAFIVADGAGPHGMQVFDLSQLREADPAEMPITYAESARYDEIFSAHNIVINEETGYAYAVGSRSGGTTCGGGLHMINIQDPLKPTFAGCFADESTGRSKTGYTHDAQCVVYRGPDTDYQGKEICFNASETALSIADVTDKANPVALSSAEYPNVGYLHQGWLTEDQKYYFMNDELDELQGKVSNTRTLIWNVEDLDDPLLAREFFLSTTASDHNLYIRDNLMYQSNYISGLRVLDITDAENPREVGYFDTVPLGENVPSFGGSWSNYPFFKSGIIAVTSNTEGVFLLRKSEVDL